MDDESDAEDRGETKLALNDSIADTESEDNHARFGEFQPASSGARVPPHNTFGEFMMLYQMRESQRPGFTLPNYNVPANNINDSDHDEEMSFTQPDPTEQITSPDQTPMVNTDKAEAKEDDIWGSSTEHTASSPAYSLTQPACSPTGPISDLSNEEDSTATNEEEESG